MSPESDGRWGGGYPPSCPPPFTPARFLLTNEPVMREPIFAINYVHSTSDRQKSVRCTRVGRKLSRARAYRGSAGFRNAAKRFWSRTGHVDSKVQLSSLDARCDVAACVAVMSDAERQRQSRLLTPHCRVSSATHSKRVLWGVAPYDATMLIDFSA
eukprot:1416474-Prymnesium_polylepis.2